MKRINPASAARAMVLAVLAVGVCSCGSKVAPTDAKIAQAPPSAAVPDLSGLWRPVGSGVDPIDGVTYTGADDVPAGLGPPFGSMPELKGVYLESFQQRRKALDSAGLDFKTSCKVLGMPTVMVGPYAVEIWQTAAQINWAQEFLRETRRIYLDGRAHPNPEEYPPTFEGHSTGKWEGDTLVVETVNIRQETTLGESGHADDALGHSAKLRIVERMRLNEQGFLQVDGTVEDPEALVKPWQWTLLFRRAPKDDEFMEFVCEDNNSDRVDPATGREVTTIPARRNLQPAKP